MTVTTERQDLALKTLMKEWAEDYGPALWTDLRRQLWTVAEGRWWQLKDDDIVWGLIETLKTGDWDEWVYGYQYDDAEAMLEAIGGLRVSGNDHVIAVWAMEHLIIRPDER